MKVAIIMGSDSDLLVMVEAAKLLEEFNIPYEVSIVSAHRTPKRLYEYAEAAKDNGISVIIAGAGGSAHLPGMVASITTLPVIGVPIKSKVLDGLDSLYSIVQMPSGVPVATVSIDGARNAGILAVSILAVANTDIAEKLQEFKDSMSEAVIEKAEKLEQLGYYEYLL